MDNHTLKIDRREFISKGVSGIAAVGMMGTSIATYKATEQQKDVTQFSILVSGRFAARSTGIL